MKVGAGCAAAVVLVSLASFSPAGAQRTNRLRQLTDDPSQDGFPRWSPDGTQIVFSRFGGDIAREKNGLWLVSPEGGEPRRLTAALGEHPHWSPDGNYIAFDGDFGNTIQVVAASGGTPIRIVPESVPVIRGGQPKWSPDGSRIAFKEGPNLWLLDIATGRLEVLFTAPGMLPIPTCWPRDGEDIFIYLREAERPNASFWAISTTGQGNRQVTPEKEGVYRYADLSPDGSMLAVVWCEGRNCDLWIMAPDGDKRIRITRDPAYDDTPSWSPDGRRIAFTSARSGNFAVWIVEIDVEQVRRELGIPPK